MNWYGKNELIPVHLENNIFNFYPNREVKSTESNNVNDADHSPVKNCQQSCLLNACMSIVHMTCPPPPTQRNHNGWRSAPDAILPGHRWHLVGLGKDTHGTLGLLQREAVGGPTPTPQLTKSRCNDASPKHSKTPVLRQTWLRSW